LDVSIGPEVLAALADGRPVVALETAVLTHGLPDPDGLQAMARMAEAVRGGGGVPAVVGVLEGQATVGLPPQDWPKLLRDPWKCSARDVAVAVAQGRNGGTTVAGTCLLARRAGLKVFATGGIGGVHRGFAQRPDVSADLPVLARSPLVVVSAGAKSILDIAATLEVLETLSIPVVGYGTDDFPGFYTPHTGHPLSRRVDRPADVAGIRRAMDALGQDQALLCVQPGPTAVDAGAVEEAVASASRELERLGVQGQAVTPFLLDHLNRQAGPALLRANVDLLVHNARLAADIAAALGA